MIRISEPNIGDEEINAVVEVLKSKMLAMGPLVKELEKVFATYCGTKYAVAANSGTSALHCALFAFGIKPGDEVITTPFTFVATANSIIMQGAKPIFADISEDDYNIDPASIEERITDKTKVILPVDLYGQIFDVEKIMPLAKEHNLKVLEDACQSIAADYKGTKAGNFGDAAAFSLYATKNITSGVGGVLTTNDEEIMKQAKLFRHHGQDESKQYDYLVFGYNYRMIDMIAAIGLEQMKKVDGFTETRIRNAKLLTEGLKDVKGLILPSEKPDFKHVWHQYTIRITDEFKVSRDEFIKKMEEKEIQCKIFYPTPLHLFPQFESYGFKKGDCPVAEKLAEEVVSMPVHPLVSEKDVELIVDTIKNM